MKLTTYKALAVAACLMVVVGCSSIAPPPAENPNAGRYTITQDRAPVESIELSSIPEVIPGPVVRTIAGNRSPYTVLGKTYFVLPSEEGYSERGIASWYGEKFHGHKTSNGEVFDMYHVSAAHKSLPIPSFLKVTNLDNNRSIVVRVNDRGPFHGNRLIDLSYAAALKLGYAETGTARVQLESIVAENFSIDSIKRNGLSLQAGSSNSTSTTNQYLQVAAFSSRINAQELSNKLEGILERPVLINSVTNPAGTILYRVRIGPINDPIELEKIAGQLVAAKFDRPYPVRQ